MKEDRTLSEEQRKTAREAITRDEVEKGKSNTDFTHLNFVRKSPLWFSLSMAKLSALTLVHPSCEPITRLERDRARANTHTAHSARIQIANTLRHTKSSELGRVDEGFALRLAFYN